MDFIYITPAWLLALGLLLCTLLVLELGFRIGSRRPIENPKAEAAYGIVQGSVLGLMAFLLAFSFSFAASRFEARRDQMEKEANAIGTAYLRAQLVEAPAGPLIVSLFPRYVDARMAIYRAGVTDPNGARAAQKESSAIQGQMWQAMKEAMQRDKTDRRNDLLVNSLNDTFDSGDDHLDTRRQHVPPVIYLLLILAILLSGCMVGYGFGQAKERSLPAWILFACLTSLVILVILDLDRPERGLIRTDPTPLILVRQSMG